MKKTTPRGINGNCRGVIRSMMGLSAALLLAITVSCATAATYFTWSNDVSRQFTEGEVLPGYRYYYGGPPLKPNAIVAISPAYTLESPHWHAMDVTPASLKAIIDAIQFVPDAEYKTTPNGARIFTPNGELIGVWYSVFEYPQVRLTGPRQIYLSDPIPRLPRQTRIKARHDD